MLKNILEEYTNDYNNKIFNIFVKIIDDTKEKCKKENKGIIDTYIEVNKVIEDGFNLLQDVQGVKDTNFDLMSKVYNYIDDIIEKTKNKIQFDAQIVLDSTDLGSLKENYELLMSEIEIIDSALELNIMDVFQDMESWLWHPRLTVLGFSLKLQKIWIF